MQPLTLASKMDGPFQEDNVWVGHISLFEAVNLKQRWQRSWLDVFMLRWKDKDVLKEEKPMTTKAGFHTKKNWRSKYVYFF